MVKQTNEHRCNMTCAAGGPQRGHLSARTCFKCGCCCPPMNGTIGHSNNEQHILLKFSNTRAPLGPIPVHVWLVCNSAADYYRVERAVASRLKGCPPPILRFSLSPQAGEVSRSRSHSVSRTGPNLLLFRLVTSARTPCH